MVTTFTLLVPSRGRPEALAALVASALDLAERPDAVSFSVRLDIDDPDVDRYLDLVPEARFAVRERCPLLSGLWDECRASAEGEVLFLAGDDCRFRTPGWDTLVAAAFEAVPDRLVVVYGRDGIADERMATHPFIHRRWPQVAGHLCPPIFAGDYSDLWIHETADALGRLRYLPDLEVEHLHPSAGKAAMDATYADKMARMTSQHTHEVWVASSAVRALDIERLAAVIAS